MIFFFFIFSSIHFLSPWFFLFSLHASFYVILRHFASFWLNMTDWTVGHSDHCRRHVFQHCSFSIKGSLPCLWVKYVDKEDIWTRQPNTHAHILPSLYLICIFTQICIHAHKHTYTHTHINVTVKSECNIFYLYFSLCHCFCLSRERLMHREKI
jgi:hypothetical protein